MLATQTSSERRRRRSLVGGRIRALRTEHGLTMSPVCALTWLIVGYLSQLETDKDLPSLETLAVISYTFGVPITWLLTAPAPPPRIPRREDRRCNVEAPGLRAEEVDGGYARGLRVIEVVGEPGARSTIMTDADAGEDHDMLLEGRVRLRQG